MAKERKPEPELPLFDLPLYATEEDEEDLGVPPEVESLPKGQATLPDLVVEQPKLNRPAGSPSVLKDSAGREPAVTPRARLAERRAEKLMEEESDLQNPFDDDMFLSLAAPIGERALAGLADLGIQLLMLSLAALASHFVGVELSLDLWPPFLGLGLVLSFLYWIIPLAFWGQTPGMAWLGNIARSFDDEPLSFGQALLRWLGAWITAGLLGLPQLLALGGRSLSDRLSDSKTLVLADDFEG